ncbi:MAG TPA: hypothetical protein PLL94_00640 [Bacteroidales bacterium]|nr:hypothetical protein [Bacteroidales bacterium]HOU00986.1 hypothetical protein [Bacteroidales bacterium]HQK66623.1 hypothetical protein [Bacteroidales bacterium]
MGYSNKDYLKRGRDLHPQISFGIFLIVLGLALLVATNDMLHLGSIKEYFTWQTVMVFIGVLLLLNLHFIPGLLLIAGGVWFLLDDHFEEIPALIKTLYWPAVMILLGISFIISSFFKRFKKDK